MALHRSRSVEYIRPETELQILKKSPRSRSCRKKSVQWSNDLEQVRYFEPRKTRAANVKRKISQIKKRAAAITDGPLKKINLGASKTGWRKFRCLTKQSMSLDTGMETYEDYNRQWDLLFEMYTVSSSQIDNDITNREKRTSC